MTNIFTPFSKEKLKVFTGDYLKNLKQRNGEVDLIERTLSKREKYFDNLEKEKIRWKGKLIDQDVFYRNEERRKPESNLDEKTLWALAVAKTNRSERYGVEYSLNRENDKTKKVDDPSTYIEHEEFYHTRILKDTLEILNLEMRLIEPPMKTKTMIKSMVHLPKYWGNVVILCAEIAGVVTFKSLAEKAEELFHEQPKPSELIQKLFQQIIVDEEGHVHYARSQMGPKRLELAKNLLPVFSKYLINDIPELGMVLNKEKLKKRIVEAKIDDYKFQ